MVSFLLLCQNITTKGYLQKGDETLSWPGTHGSRPTWWPEQKAENSHLTNKHEAVRVEGAGLKFSKSIWHDVLPPAKLHLPKLPKPTNQGPRVQRPPPMGDIPYSKH